MTISLFVMFSSLIMTMPIMMMFQSYIISNLTDLLAYELRELVILAAKKDFNGGFFPPLKVSFQPPS